MSEGEPPRRSGIVRFGVFDADLDAGELRREGRPVKLQDQPFHLLAFLVQRPGVIVTREELRAALWPGDTFVDFDYGVNTAIKKVRWALGDSADNPRFIQTVPRKGYRFIAPVSPEESPAVTPAVPVAGFPKHRRAWFFAAGLAAVLAAGVWLLIPASTPGPVGVPVPLTAYPGAQYGAAFSPDGRQVAFAWNGVEEDNFDIYVKANGSDSLRRLTEDPAADLSPAWSPDGRRIAFLRDLSQGRVAIMIVPAAGGFAVKVAETHAPLDEHYRNLAFTPDGNWLITTSAPSAAPGQNAGGQGLFLHSTENGACRPLTQPPVGYDLNPALSPDGRYLAFLRGPHLASADLYVVRLNPDWSAAEEPRRITSWNRFALTPVWTADGREVIMASGEYFDTRLWRVPVFASGKPSLIGSAGEGVCLPALAPDGRLAFSQRYKRVSIWSLDLTASSQAGSRLRRWPASSSRIDTNPRFSPDGRRVAFGSTRTGARQIWIANSDGSDPLQLTSMAATFIDQPSWSPDASMILFRALKDQFFEFYTVSAAGGTPRRLVRGSTGDGWPVFSADGRRIYFNSKRTGAYQIWRMSAQGGAAVQLTLGGGQGPRESADGRFVYFGRTAPGGSESIWRVPAGGGEETLVEESVLGLCFDLAQNGLYYVGACGTDGLCPMYFYSFVTGRRTKLAASSLPGDNGLAVSPDGRTLLRGQVTELGADIMVLEALR